MLKHTNTGKYVVHSVWPYIDNKKCRSCYPLHIMLMCDAVYFVSIGATIQTTKLIVDLHMSDNQLF